VHGQLFAGNDGASTRQHTIEPPMSRQDIADYLGLTIEIGSRTLALLASAATIEAPTSRRIVLRDRSALTQPNG
jgi:CRP/FNR family nitrogen fixation transcriptional regulator